MKFSAAESSSRQTDVREADRNRQADVRGTDRDRQLEEAPTQRPSVLGCQQREDRQKGGTARISAGITACLSALTRSDLTLGFSVAR